MINVRLHGLFTRAQKRCMFISPNRYRKPHYPVRASVKAMKIIHRGVMCKVLGLISGLLSNTCDGLVGWLVGPVSSHTLNLSSLQAVDFIKKNQTNIFSRLIDSYQFA